ncbi:glycosyltransferase [Pseudoroseicyclus tamaricis]|uniref:Glycosyltransferase n=1 Tax=Pseudoroseicyclus tamaricis TaxID=2705421 RepID=A0A6B2JWX2_9RHOB|nr:glycosyltransferase [Pseudoroseicyclus tamaricis]NDV02630.1 glycosyltransferase [Pseudoroseicyclus tamaricis]
MAAPHIHILLCTHNGGPHLADQLESYGAQAHGDWSLWVSDDASTDDTRATIARFADRHPGRQVRLFDGPALGPAANYLSLLLRPEIPDGWVAFSDQDDVWLPHKLKHGLAEMGARGAQVYASRTILTDAHLTRIGPSVVHRRGPSFSNALVQNILAGNTLILDPDAFARLRAMTAAALQEGIDPPHHDWWIYLAMSGAGLPIVNDMRPGLLYRQHATNSLGAHRGLRAGTARATLLKDRHYAGWLATNLAALSAASMYMTPPNRTLAEAFGAMRQVKGGAARLAELRRLGLKRQSWRGDLVLAGLALTGRL